MADYTVENHGSILLVRPEGDAAREYLESVTNHPEVMWYGGALVVEPRYVSELVDGLREAGYTVN